MRPSKLYVWVMAHGGPMSAASELGVTLPRLREWLSGVRMPSFQELSRLYALSRGYVTAESMAAARDILIKTPKCPCCGRPLKKADRDKFIAQLYLLESKKDGNRQSGGNENGGRVADSKNDDAHGRDDGKCNGDGNQPGLDPHGHDCAGAGESDGNEDCGNLGGGPSLDEKGASAIGIWVPHDG
ncbi:MAG TPA: hypothetical protein VFF88_01765 [Methylocella sp.]|nr:hypothetical protein [Methylocella sp.]